MPRPVFFSVGGPQDTNFATSVKELLPDAMVYLYTRTGEEGVSFQSEIELELQACRLFVVFWSEDYIKSDAAKTELARARRLAETIDPHKQVLIIQVRRKSPNLAWRWTNPIDPKATNEFALGKWRFERALDPAPDAHKVAEFVRRKLEGAESLGRTLVSRPLVTEAIRKAVIRPDFSANEFVFVSGLEGDGRRTALRHFIKSSYGNLTERQVSLDSAEGPEDLLMRLSESAGIPTSRRESLMTKIENGEASALKEIRRLIYQARNARSYYVIALDRFSGVDTVGIPDWLSEAFGRVQSGNAPLVILVTSSPVTDALLEHYPHASRVRVPGLDEREMAELVHRLSADDPKSGDWTAERKRTVQQVSGSSPSLCQTIMLCLRNEGSLDFLERIANREEEKFSASMSVVLGHIIQNFKARPNDILALRVIERFGLTSKKALDEITEPLIGHENYDLYSMLEYGLVERLSDDVLRIPPLIQRRLGYILENERDNSKLDILFDQFARKMMVGNDEYGAVYASNKAVTALTVDAPENPRLSKYLTTANLFKVGLDRYNNYDYPRAHAVLSRAMDRLIEGVTIDLTAQIEIARFFGLSAARIGFPQDVKRACHFLDDSLRSTSRARQGEAMASFLRGFAARQDGKYLTAIEEFERANASIAHVKLAERQRGAILTELSRAYLRKVPPNYSKAVNFAQQAYDEKDAPHNLSGLIRAKLYQTFGLRRESGRLFQEGITSIRELIAELKQICNRTGRDFHLFREAELEAMLAIHAQEVNGARIDLSKSIALIEQAMTMGVSARRRFFLWKIRLLDENADHSDALLVETQRILSRSGDYPPRDVADAAKIHSLVRSRTNIHDARDVLHAHKGSMGSWAVNFVTRVIRAHGAISLDEKLFFLDRL